jgi:hypothetical protein
MATTYELAQKVNSKQQFLDRVSGGVQGYTAVPAQLIRSKPNYYFRSDTREPAAIFLNGFTPREQGGMVYRLMRQDIAPESAVSVTSRFDVAALFPIKTPAENPPAETKIYVVFVRQVFNTRRVQARFAARSIRDQGADQVEKAKGNLFADERATNAIAADDVIACITITRQWNGNDYLAGGTYNITGYEFNAGMNNQHKNMIPKAASLPLVRQAVGASGILATSSAYNVDADRLYIKYRPQFAIGYNGGDDLDIDGLFA